MRIMTKRIKKVSNVIDKKKNQKIFAFLPIKIKNEIRWFEKVSVVYVCYKSSVKHNEGKKPTIKRFWKPIDFK